VALAIVGLIILMVLFVKCCAVHTPSSNPNKPPARKLSQTLTLRRRQHGAARGPDRAAQGPRVCIIETHIILTNADNGNKWLRIIYSQSKHY